MHFSTIVITFALVPCVLCLQLFLIIFILNKTKDNGFSWLMYNKHYKLNTNVTIVWFQNRIREMPREEMEALLLRVCNANPSLMLELFEGEVVEGAGYHPPGGGSAPDWCVCGRCRQMPTEQERVCCRKAPAHCTSALPVCFYLMKQYRSGSVLLNLSFMINLIISNIVGANQLPSKQPSCLHLYYNCHG